MMLFCKFRQHQNYPPYGASIGAPGDSFAGRSSGCLEAMGRFLSEQSDSHLVAPSNSTYALSVETLSPALMPAPASPIS